MNALANLLVFVAKLGVTPQLGLQRHLTSKGAPKASQGVPKGSQKDCLGSRAGVIGVLIPQTVLALWGSHVGYSWTRLCRPRAAPRQQKIIKKL